MSMLYGALFGFGVAVTLMMGSVVLAISERRTVQQAFSFNRSNLTVVSGICVFLGAFWGGLMGVFLG